MQSIREKERLVPYYIHQNYWFLYYHDVNYFAVKFDKQNITEFDTFISRN